MLQHLCFNGNPLENFRQIPIIPKTIPIVHTKPPCLRILLSPFATRLC